MNAQTIERLFKVVDILTNYLFIPKITLEEVRKRDNERYLRVELHNWLHYKMHKGSLVSGAQRFSMKSAILRIIKHISP
jgi:hypothetical protein